MKRIIREYAPPTLPQEGTVVPMLPNAIALRYNGKFYIDYLAEDSVDNPIGAYYVGTILNDGTVIDLIGDASKFPHTFSASDYQAPVEEKLTAITITPRQARLALLQSGHLETVEAMIAEQPRQVQIQWEFANEINRCDLLVCGMLAALGLTSDQIDTLFNLASTL
jgi:hypothetical protein